MNTFFSFVTMSAILFLVYTQITYIKADWCSAEIDRTRDHLYSIIEHFDIPVDVKIECPKQNLIKLSSINKEKLGAAAAKIRSFRKPEPFKGKGIKYIDEYIFRKEGKKK